MNELLERLKEDFKNPEARYTYADSVVNAFISAQIKALREDRKLTQEQLADLMGTKQSGISRLQKADYAGWKVETLRKFARAFGVRLQIRFEEFGSLLPDISGFTKDRVAPRKFEDDPVFNEQPKEEPEKAAAAIARFRLQPRARATLGDDLSWLGNSLEVANKVASDYPKLRRMDYLESSQSERAVLRTASATMPQTMTGELAETLAISVSDSAIVTESVSNSVSKAMTTAKSVSETKAFGASLLLIQGGGGGRTMRHRRRRGPNLRLLALLPVKGGLWHE